MILQTACCLLFWSMFFDIFPKKQRPAAGIMRLSIRQTSEWKLRYQRFILESPRLVSVLYSSIDIYIDIYGVLLTYLVLYGSMLFRLLFLFYLHLHRFMILIVEWSTEQKNCWLERCVRKSLKRFVSFHRMGKNFFSPLCSRRLHGTKNRCASGWSGLGWHRVTPMMPEFYFLILKLLPCTWVYNLCSWVYFDKNSFTVVKCIVLIDLIHSSLLLMLSLDLQIDLNGIPWKHSSHFLLLRLELLWISSNIQVFYCKQSRCFLSSSI